MSKLLIRLLAEYSLRINIFAAGVTLQFSLLLATLMPLCSSYRQPFFSFSGFYLTPAPPAPPAPKATTHQQQQHTNSSSTPTAATTQRLHWPVVVVVVGSLVVGGASYPLARFMVALCSLLLRCGRWCWCCWRASVAAVAAVGAVACNTSAVAGFALAHSDCVCELD